MLNPSREHSHTLLNNIVAKFEAALGDRVDASSAQASEDRHVVTDQPAEGWSAYTIHPLGDCPTRPPGSGLDKSDPE